MKRFILGIDPGLGGALALYTLPEDGFDTPPVIHDMPNHPDGGIDAAALVQLVTDLVNGLPRHGQIHAAIENVGSRPRQAGAFAFGLSTGIIHGVLAAAGVPFTLVSPAVWKASMGLRRHVAAAGQAEETPAQNKTRARQLAAQLFPGAASQFKRIRDDGRAEALLLAVYFANRKEK